MKIAPGAGEVIGLKRSVREHTESVMVGDLISDPLVVPPCLVDRPENEVIGYLHYGSNEVVAFDTQVSVVVGDVVTFPGDSGEYLVHRSYCSPGSNVEIYSVMADRDLPTSGEFSSAILQLRNGMRAGR